MCKKEVSADMTITLRFIWTNRYKILYKIGYGTKRRSVSTPNIEKEEENDDDLRESKNICDFSSTLSPSATCVMTVSS